MILFSLGTHSQDFSRMAKAADDYAATTDERIVVQTGYTRYSFKNVKEHFDFCPKERMQQLIVEHVHDQGQVARKMDELGCVICCMDEKDLPQMIEKARTFDFKPLRRGSAKIVADTLYGWFYKK